MSEQSTKRILPAEVMEAYRVTGLVPVQGDMGGTGITYASPTHCCGEGAIAAANGIQDCGDRYAFCEVKYGMDYANGFQAGFDGWSLPQKCTARYLQGHSDGVACAKAVFGEAGS